MAARARLESAQDEGHGQVVGEQVGGVEEEDVGRGEQQDGPQGLGVIRPGSESQSPEQHKIHDAEEAEEERRQDGVLPDQRLDQARKYADNLEAQMVDVGGAERELEIPVEETLRHPTGHLVPLLVGEEELPTAQNERHAQHDGSAQNDPQQGVGPPLPRHGRPSRTTRGTRKQATGSGEELRQPAPCERRMFTAEHAHRGDGIRERVASPPSRADGGAQPWRSSPGLGRGEVLNRLQDGNGRG